MRTNLLDTWSFGCVEVEIGQGYYDVNKDTLVLWFKNNALVEQFQRIKTTGGSSDKLIVNIETTMSDTRVGSAGVNCYLKTSKRANY